MYVRKNKRIEKDKNLLQLEKNNNKERKTNKLYNFIQVKWCICTILTTYKFIQQWIQIYKIRGSKIKKNLNT